MNKGYNYRYLLLSLAALLGTAAPLEAEVAREVPRLVVNIMIDQLRTDYMEAFSPLYGDRGFKRLLTEGVVYSRAEYPFANPDRSSAVACLVTGASPYDNGIVAEKWLDRKTLLPVYSVDDKDFAGNLTPEYSSPVNLLVSTLGDEIKANTSGRALVYSVAPFRDAAVLGAGHAADGAFWINDVTGQWCGSSYYGTYPQWAITYDNYSSFHKNFHKTEWTPINELVGNFNYFLSGSMQKPFLHRFTDEDRFRNFKTSALVAEEEVRFLRTLIMSNAMGMDVVPDLLNVTFYAGTYQHGGSQTYPMELQDTYVRLDFQLGVLMDEVEKMIGREKVLFVVTGTGCCDPETEADLSKYRIPTGTFNINRASLLLNMYLMAVYGQGQWVEAVLGNQLYLNLKLVEQKNINLTEMLERCGDFLIQLAGVKDVYTSQRLALGAWTPGVSRLRNGYNPKVSGDILIQTAPGWTTFNDVTGEKRVAREGYLSFPLFFLGNGLTHEVKDTPVTVDCVAPTVSKILRIRSPNACAKTPLF